MKKPIIEILFYLVLPIAIWKYGREPLGDYYAMLFSTVPAILYTIYSFFKEKQFNVTGLFLVMTMTISTVLSIMSGGAEEMLWVGVYMNFGLAGFWLLTMLVGKPFVLYFAVDLGYVQGYPREESRALFFKKENMRYFYGLTFFCLIRDVLEGFLRIYLIYTVGVNGYDKILFIHRSVGWGFTLLLALLIMYTYRKIQQNIGPKPPLVVE
ncbi:VC0807 family protein [Bacillus tianshenii]|nr:VC0807 family protein [Bacillus tianshenii]